MATIEVFTAGCPVCDSGIELVREVAGEEDEVIVIDLNRDADSAQRATDYGVKSVPAVAVDGALIGCCRNAGPRRQELAAALE